MLDLSFVQECQEEAIEDVREALDTMYIKRHCMMEACEDSVVDDYFMEAGLNIGSSKELDVFSFDSSHIIKAIRHFNKAFNELDFSNTTYVADKKEQEKGNINSSLKISPELVDQTRTKFTATNSHFMKGFEELEKQFDCSFSIYTSPRSGTGTAILKFPPGQTINKITVSKKKGFQLGGLPIILNINIKQILDIIPPNKKIFGQTFTGIILHEIYHNIVHCIDLRNKNLHAIIKSTFSNTTDSKIKSLMNDFKNMFSIKDRDFNEEKSMNRFKVLNAVKDNVGAMKQFENDIKNNTDKTDSEKELDEYINKLRTVNKVLSVRKASTIVAVGCSILLAGLGFVFGSSLAVAGGVVCLAIMALSMLKKKVLSLFSVSVGVQEEYFCDLFAAMYKLPIHLTSYNRQIALNKKHRDKVNEIRNRTNKISDDVHDPHPTTFDREMVSYQMAKQMLESKTPMKKEIKRYLKYIVDIHEGMEDMDNPHTRNQARKLDPEAAKDLQRTLNDFVRKSGVTVTESYLTFEMLDEMFPDDEIIEEEGEADGS